MRVATQYAPAPFKSYDNQLIYENRQRLQVTTEFAKRQTTTRKNKHCAILPSLCRHYQSKAKNSRICSLAITFLPISKLTYDLLTLKVVSESRVTWAASVPILVLVFLGLSVLDLCPMYASDRRQTDRYQTKASLNASARGGGDSDAVIFDRQYYTRRWQVMQWHVASFRT